MLNVIRVKKIFSTDLVKVSSLNAVATLIKLLTSFVSVKLVAGWIGPPGIALLGQLNNFSAILLSIANGGITNGVTKYVAQYNRSEKRYAVIIGTSFWITLMLSVVTGLVIILNAGYFSDLILHDRQYNSIMYVFGGTIILYAINTLLIAILNGFKEYRKYVIVNIAGSITGLLFSIALAYFWGIPGALIAAVTYQSVVVIITLSLLLRSPWFSWRALTARFSGPTAKRLAHYSVMALVSAMVVPGSQLFVRSFITGFEGDGLREAGLWEGMNRISNLYLMVVTTSIGVYLIPRLAELHSRFELRQEIIKVYKVLIPFLLAMSLAIFLTKDLVIRILFSKEFAGMEKFFAPQLIGDILKMSSWVLGSIYLAKTMTRTFILMEVGCYSLFAVSSYLLVREYGAIGATYGHIISHLGYLIVSIVIFRKLLFNSSDSTT